jgi:type I restriction enzyme, S subunit
MFSAKIKVSELAQRIDPEHHNPVLLAMKRKVEDAFPTSTFRKECLRMNSGPFGSSLLSSSYVSKEEGVLFVRPQDCKDLIVNEDNNNVYISFEDNERLSSSKFGSGSIIITKIGNGIGDMAVIPSHLDVCNISGNAMGAVLNNIDCYFSVAFLKGSYGKAEVKRGLSGGAKPKIDMESIGSIVFPLVNPIVQKYIGDKVRQAGRLRAWAKLLGRAPVMIEALIKGYLSTEEIVSAQQELELGNVTLDKNILSRFTSNGLKKEKNKSFSELVAGCVSGSVDTEREYFHLNRIQASDIEDFLTAQTYRPAITAAYSMIKGGEFDSLQDLCIQPIRQGATPKFSATGKNCLKSKQTRDIFLEDAGYETVDPEDPENSSIVRLVDGDLVITRQGAGTVGRASIYLGHSELYITDSLFLVRVDKEKSDSAFIAAYLRSYTGQRLIEKGVYGSTGQLNLGNSNVRNIPVLKLDMCIQRYFGDKVRLADSLKSCSTSLIRSSKLLVEALIEGQTTEQQLIFAQQALDSGDNSQDREILSCLTTEGFDAEGVPLFPDLDLLYDLLAQSQKIIE